LVPVKVARSCRQELEFWAAEMITPDIDGIGFDVTVSETGALEDPFGSGLVTTRVPMPLLERSAAVRTT
jgi:hypothetical protein